MFVKFVAWIWRFIATFWSTFIAMGALGLIVAAEVYEPLKSNREVYFLILLNAIVVMLIEIRLRPELNRTEAKDHAVTVFETMRKARPTILDLLVKETRKGEPGHVVILGGRIRSIIEIVRQLSDELDKISPRKVKGCDIEIYMMRPSFVSQLMLPGQKTKEQQAARNASIVAQMDASVAELARMCDQEVFRSRHVNIEVNYYDELPFGYFYLIGEDNLVFGGFIWSDAEADLVGPASPCMHMTSDAPEFEITFDWLKNRVELYKAADRANPVQRTHAQSA